MIILYKNSTEDPVVKYYDQTLGVSGKSEIEWYTEKVNKFGGPILDIACGTGRISLLFAELGYKITAFDSSEGMLQIFQNKLDKFPILENLISLYNAPMQDFHFGEKFSTILCIDAFFHNLNITDETRCLSCVTQHLSPKGRFFFNVHNFNPNFIEKCKESKGKIWTERNSYWIRNRTEKIVVEQALDILESKKLIITLLKFNRFDKNGKILSKEYSKWISHYRTLEHYRKIFNLTGLKLEQVIGSYKNEPIDESSQLIFQLKLD